MLRCSLCNRRVIVWYELKSSQFHFEMSESVTPTGIAVSNSELPSREPYIRGGGASFQLPLQRNKDFFGSALISWPLEVSAWFYFPLLNHIFLLPLCHFWCSGTVQNCPENGKNRKEIKWLLMAPPKIFRVARAFLFLEIFQRLFSRNVQHKIVFQNINFFFLHLERGTEKRAKSQKRLFWNKKTTLKLK